VGKADRIHSSRVEVKDVWSYTAVRPNAYMKQGLNERRDYVIFGSRTNS
jgi:hypothetical protein